MLKVYSYKPCPTESSAGCTLLYNGNYFSCKLRSALCFYNSTELWSTFIEI